MGKGKEGLYEKLVRYYETTPQEEIDRVWAKSADMDEFGIRVGEFMEILNDRKEILEKPLAERYLIENGFQQNKHGFYIYQSANKNHSINLEKILEDFLEFSKESKVRKSDEEITKDIFSILAKHQNFVFKIGRHHNRGFVYRFWNVGDDEQNLMTIVGEIHCFSQYQYTVNFYTHEGFLDHEKGAMSFKSEGEAFMFMIMNSTKQCANEKKN